MKKLILSVSAATTMAVPALAAADLSSMLADSISANVALTSDYRFRGISQTDKDVALQGGFDFNHESGFYVGTWGSNVDNFSPSPVDGTSGAQLEIDFYAGFGGAITENLSGDFNVLYFYYPGASTAGGQAEIDYIEFTPSVSYDTDMGSASFGVSYSPDFFAESGDAYYYNLGADVPLIEGVGLGLHVGRQEIADNTQFGTPDYTDWSVSLSKSFVGLDWSVSYVDTDLDESECFGGSDLCDATGVVSVSKSF